MPSKRLPSRSLAVVVLAAGHGKRIKSATPKVLHAVAGRPSLWHLLTAAARLRPSTISVVVGSPSRERVEEAVRSWTIRPAPSFVDQGRQLGTGHAVASAEAATEGADDVLILPGDDPLVTTDQLRLLLRVHRRTRSAATILTTELDDPTGYGRVRRLGDQLVGIIEEGEADAATRAIREVSTLFYAFRREDLYRALPRVGRENRQREQYLPDVLAILTEKGEAVSATPVDLGGSLGINTRRGLAAVSRIMRDRIVEGHMRKGVTFVDPRTAYIDVDVRIGPDTVIQPNTLVQGATRIGAGCTIGPSTRIVDSTVGDGAEVSFAVVRETKVGPRVSVGPFASLRPGTVLMEGSKAGTFVEVKASRVGKGSKVPHLSYVGDATIGERANVGAGSITCNYDGFEKHRTVIGDEAFVGSDTMLVAPVRIGRRAVTGAGSAITRDVPDGALAVERAEQRTVEGYAERRRSTRARGTGGPDRPGRADGDGPKTPGGHG
jgi:bifunctional UDP-N-acetylglucosamine pyrophosphorylase/glucosamine-1-phosphate N-acetyltransferase